MFPLSDVAKLSSFMSATILTNEPCSVAELEYSVCVPCRFTWIVLFSVFIEPADISFSYNSLASFTFISFTCSGNVIFIVGFLYNAFSTLLLFYTTLNITSLFSVTVDNVL